MTQSVFRFLTSGESHGRGLAIIIEGIPAGLALEEDYIAQELKRRQKGYGRGSRMELEQDRAEILSGMRHGLTMGSPIALIIWNKDWENWKDVMSPAPTEKETKPVTRLRPGHADLAGAIKYGFDDVRLVLERASARDTAARVAVGAVARRFLQEFGIAINSHTMAIGGKWAQPHYPVDWQQVEGSPLRCADAAAEKAMIAAIDEARAAGDTLGGVFEVVATGVPIGLGSYVQWDRRLDGRIAKSVMSIPAVKGVEIGDGLVSAEKRGSQVHDLLEPLASFWHHTTNRAGGIEGGITNGEPVVVRGFVKPIPTLGKPLPTLDLRSGERVLAHFERSDVCVVPAAGVVGENMLAIVFTEALLEKFGGDNMRETLRNYRHYQESISYPRAEIRE